MGHERKNVCSKGEHGGRNSCGVRQRTLSSFLNIGIAAVRNFVTLPFSLLCRRSYSIIWRAFRMKPLPSFSIREAIGIIVLRKMFFQEILVGTVYFLLDAFKTVLKYAFIFEKLCIREPNALYFREKCWMIRVRRAISMSCMEVKINVRSFLSNRYKWTTSSR